MYTKFFNKPKYLLGALIPAIFSFNVSATVIDNTFDGGIPANWGCTGNCGVAGADGVVTAAPTGANNYGWVSTDNGVNGVGLDGLVGTDGSVLTSNLFAANAGDDLEFFFNYVTSDGAGYADYAWARLLDESLNQVAMLFTARTKESGNIVPGIGMPAPEATLSPGSVEIIAGAPSWSVLGSDSNSCFSSGCGYTGWVQSNYSILTAGSYYLEFGVTNWTDTAHDSGLAFDGITIAGVAIDPVAVPEPAGVALFSLALLGLARIKRNRV
ncbi:hypothetical protein GCM10009111_09030 [Colwellia asteriadis]|uniref:PEP-CTERM protein-sorting domain-containing protein n=1 Tax=Colwellia asteriadis TaxID=517723 RepID=A0ABN1L4F4_9GAMM